MKLVYGECTVSLSQISTFFFLFSSRNVTECDVSELVKRREMGNVIKKLLFISLVVFKGSPVCCNMVFSVNKA